jgi:thioredoxin-like negative regulator of GroEL
MSSNNYYEKKYLKYKTKYYNFIEQQKIQNMTGGANDKIDIMLFKAEWCTHCKTFKPTWEQLKNQYNTKFNFITYDSVQDEGKIKQMKVQGFPSIKFKDGAVVQDYNGPRGLEELQSILDNLVKI